MLLNKISQIQSEKDLLLTDHNIGDSNMVTIIIEQRDEKILIFIYLNLHSFGFNKHLWAFFGHLRNAMITSKDDVFIY